MNGFMVLPSFSRRLQLWSCGFGRGEELGGTKVPRRDSNPYSSAEFCESLTCSSRTIAASANRCFQFHKRSQYLIGANDETVSVTMRVDNPDRSAFKVES